MEKYTELTVPIMFCKRFLKTLSDQGGSQRPDVKIHLQNPQALELGGKEYSQMPDKVVGESLELLEAQRAKFAPKWWSEWLALNRPESEIKSGDENAGTSLPKDKVAD